MKQGLLKLKSSNKQLNKSVKFGFWSKVRGLFDKMNMSTTYNLSPALLDTNLSMYSEMRQFQAYLTKNAYDMSIMNESNVWPHVNFGTIDNPVLVFGAGTTWRMVVCSGPGSEEESSSHEKMYMVLREGPIHRCLFCGQCFKLMKLKDDITSDDNLYYSSVFTQIADKVVGSQDYFNSYTYGFTNNDSVDYSSNVIPKNRAYVFVNNYESDHLMVDPAFRMKFYKDCETDYLKMNLVVHELERQAKLAGLEPKREIAKDVFETWVKIEQDILKFDRLYNRHEKFLGRSQFDPENHERREKRMLQRHYERTVENYTFYAGGLTEEEQMYRDYYQSDLEEYPENDIDNRDNDLTLLSAYGEFNINNYSFLESSTYYENTNPVEGFVDKQMFRYRYRRFSDTRFSEKNDRVNKRFLERASKRDPRVVKDLGDRIEEIYVKKGLRCNLTGAEEEIKPHAEYLASEGFAQFKDYYESELESGEINKEILEDLPERDRLRFIECYENDLNLSTIIDKTYITIPKKPFNNSKSVVHNFFDDLVDFNYRVKPLARHLAFKDVASKYQSLPLKEDESKIYTDQNDRYRKVLDFKKAGITHADNIKH